MSKPFLYHLFVSYQAGWRRGQSTFFSLFGSVNPPHHILSKTKPVIHIQHSIPIPTFCSIRTILHTKKKRKNDTDKRRLLNPKHHITLGYYKFLSILQERKMKKHRRECTRLSKKEIDKESKILRSMSLTEGGRVGGNSVREGWSRQYTLRPEQLLVIESELYPIGMPPSLRGCGRRNYEV